MRIKYFCYYDSPKKKHPRDCVPSATTKIDYIVDKLIEQGYEVDLISNAFLTTSKTLEVDNGGLTQLTEHKSVRHFLSVGSCCSRWLRFLGRFLGNLHLFLWCLLNVHYREQIIVYHSLGYCELLYWICKIKQCILIGEIEEIYQDVHKQNYFVSKSEFRFIERCDKFIFPTALLNDKLNKEDKPYLVIHGIYKIEPRLVDSERDGKIHIIYAGTLDSRKGGGIAAAAAAFLDHGFHIHICGFGNSDEVERICRDVNLQGKGIATFDGLFRGVEFVRKIQSCTIGLSTQNPSEAYNKTSFPSKILTYMANGLQVVSVRIPAIETSSVGDVISYYEEQTPQAIAKAILKARSLDRQAGYARLEELNRNFATALSSLLAS